jgi:predicted nucleic acid-binding protein
VLQRVFGRILIQPAVDAEVFGASRRASLPRPDWIRLGRLNASERLAASAWSLDPGESEAIALALKRRALLVIDEKRGRGIAQQLGLRITGTLGVLLVAKSQGLIEHLAPLREPLLAAGFRVSDRLWNEVVTLAGESQPAEEVAER